MEEDCRRCNTRSEAKAASSFRTAARRSVAPPPGCGCCGCGCCCALIACCLLLAAASFCQLLPAAACCCQLEGFFDDDAVAIGPPPNWIGSPLVLSGGCVCCFHGCSRSLVGWLVGGRGWTGFPPCRCGGWGLGWAL